eukprot:TRINITY_DN17284_c0_g1_i2.p1 TRINITY_DN17284_c0_g1~~TRINITY_DN17284_c0_g1_i2.p1  ORF type:complete len:436 (+),score=49.77 TRINITY_DN17284_c0_g1_i2:60-1310(+)
MKRLKTLETHVNSSAPSPSPKGMLQGLRVVELATVVAAPACAALMCDMGADVIKVERPGGDGWRGDRADKCPENPAGGPHFAQNNRGKQSIVLDLKKQQHLNALLKLLSSADVFVTNVRYPALQRMGLGYDSLKKHNPRLIYAILTAWGLQGDRKNDPGYDVGAFWAASGLQDFSKPTDDGHVGQFPPAIGDHMTSLQLLSGIGLALWHRDRTGNGQFVEASLLRSGIWGMAYPLLNTALNPGKKFLREPRTNHYRPTFNVYKCKDGVWLQLLGLDEGRFDAGVCVVLGLSVEEFKDACNKRKIAMMDSAFLKQPAGYWEPLLREHNVWFQRAVQLDEVLRDPQAHAIQSFHTLPGTGFPYITSPVQMSCNPNHFPKAGPPVCGQHTYEILCNLGYSDSEARQMDMETEKWGVRKN